ncbi:hypothetical protein RCCWILLIS_92 [Rhodobacter phage RcCWillis]|nr:hypothetical protein RCCWILLIS_92 [Rhodobacter phage RcCWillis]
MARKVFFNWKGGAGRETVDELSREEFETEKAFRAEIRRLVGEYHLCGMAVYTSSRACQNWR